jgi:hypothetical protein
MPGCPECAIAGQTPGSTPLDPPQVEYVENPQPYKFPSILEAFGRRLDLNYQVIARMVSTRPFVLDVLEGAGPGAERFPPAQGELLVIALVDAKLKSVLSKLVFNQLVKAKLIYGGNAEFPHEMVLSELTPEVNAPNTPINSPSKSGLLLSYRGLVEFVYLYNEGRIYYQDPMFNVYATQALTRVEMAQLLKTFADTAFDSLPSDPPPMNPATDRYSLTLVCARYQHVSLPGLESKLAPLLSRLEDLKVRATSQTFYLLLYKDRVKQTVLQWPFPQFPLSQLVAGRWRDAKEKEAMKATVPEEFFSRLPLTFTSLGSPEDQNRYVYCADRGKTYLATRRPCTGGRPHCNTFDNLTAYEIQRAEDVVAREHRDPKNPSGTMLASTPLNSGTLWSSDVDLRLSQVAKDGLRISNEEYEKHAPFYFDLLAGGTSGGGVSLIQDGYVYRGVRICRVDPQAPSPRCLNPDAKAN